MRAPRFLPFLPRFFRSVAVPGVAMLMLALAGTVVAAPPAKSPAVCNVRTGAIVFMRSRLDANGVPRRSHLMLGTPATRSVGALTPKVAGVQDGAASWSPAGTRIAFQRGSATSDPHDRYDIYSVDRHGHRLRQLTRGAGNFMSPAWGSQRRIAFIARYRDHDCIALIDANGRNQRDLFCPPRPARLAMAPVWSTDGRSLYLHAGYTVDGLDLFWRSLVYRVDAATGAATVLGDGVLDEPMHLEFAPDGSRGIYSGVYASEMSLLDFDSDTLTPIGHGYAPRWSRDGRRIAYTGEVYENGPEFRFYEPLYVMDADGGNVRRVTRARVANMAYTAADWSADDVHLLLNRRLYVDPLLTVARQTLRIVNVDTGVITALPNGYAEAGAWHQR